MTLTSTVVRKVYDGDGATVAFPTTFVFWDPDDLLVILRDSDGNETTWVRGTQYTVSGGSGSTGTVTVDTSPTDYTPASGESLVILSNVPDTQETSLPQGGPFPSTSVEQELDKMVRRVQQTEEAIGRTLILPITTPAGVSSELPNPSASTLVGWNAAADALINYTPNAAAYITSAAVTFLEDIQGDLAGNATAIPRVNAGGTSYELRTPAQVRSDIGAAASGANTDITSLGSLSTVDINGGTIDGAVIGGNASAAGTFTTLTFSGLAHRSTTVDGIEIGLRLENTAASGNAAAQLSLGNDTNANALAMLVNSSTNSNYPGVNSGKIDCSTGDLALEASGNVKSNRITNTTVGSGANTYIDPTSGILARSTSSRRYKENIRDYTRGLSDILKLQPVWFSDKATGKTFAGFIAEDVHDAGLVEFVDYDADGRPDALHYPHMIALLASALKEQNDTISDLMARVESLESA